MWPWIHSSRSQITPLCRINQIKWPLNFSSQTLISILLLRITSSKTISNRSSSTLIHFNNNKTIHSSNLFNPNKIVQIVFNNLSKVLTVSRLKTHLPSFHKTKTQRLSSSNLRPIKNLQAPLIQSPILSKLHLKILLANPKLTWLLRTPTCNRSHNVHSLPSLWNSTYLHHLQ
jgi:hypothetical protein